MSSQGGRRIDGGTLTWTAATTEGEGASSAGSPGELQLPRRFRARRELGRGAMGVVIEAFDTTLQRDVAVKLLAPGRQDEQARLRLTREARAAGALHHPGLVTVFDADADGGFIVMELVEGCSLKEALAYDGPMAPAAVRRLAGELLDALACAHAAGIVHRDVKPANLLVDREGRVRLTDFGVATTGARDLTATGARVGTPAYMAPEQLRGQADAATVDVYAAGATIFETATGLRLHDDGGLRRGDARARLLRATRDRALVDAVMIAVAERPEDRFADAAAFAAALDQRRGLRRWWLAPLAAAALAGAALGVVTLRSDPAVGAAPGIARLAVAPFSDRSGDHRLDFAVSGLPQLLATELRRVADLDLVPHYRFRDHVGDGDPWVAARALGVDALVRGDLQAAGPDIKIEIWLERAGEGRVALLSEVVAVERVPAAVRRIAPRVASLALGRPVELGGEPGLDFGVERLLQLGVEALHRHDLSRAAEYLRQVRSLAPTEGEAAYYLALLSYWQGWPEAETTGHVRAALDLELTSSQRSFLEGLPLLTERRYPEAIAHFEAATAAEPEDRDLLYGLYEALFHGGAPDRAIEVYRRLAALHPGFALGLIHARDYYLTRRDSGGIAWALGRIKNPTDIHAPWPALADIAAGRHQQAVRRLRELADRMPLPERSQAAGHVYDTLRSAYILDGRIGFAEAVHEQIKDGDPTQTLADLGLATLRGDPGPVRTRLLEQIEQAPPGATRNGLLVGLARFALAGQATERYPSLRRALSDSLDEIRQRSDWAHVLEAYLHPRPEALEPSPYPEARAVLEARLAEARGDDAAAEAAWRAAIEASPDGAYLIIHLVHLAALLERTGDRDGFEATCERLRQPPRFFWDWTAAVSRCRP